MGWSQRVNRAAALLCAMQVCLLSLASVSPQIHSWVFHSGDCTASAVSDLHTGCETSLNTSGKHDSKPTVPDDENEICPVFLFAQGITFENTFVFQLPERRSFLSTIIVEPETVLNGCPKSGIQARAPPVS